jgi:hypothetical protein
MASGSTGELAVPPPRSTSRQRAVNRVRGAVAALGAGALGAAPHVLHHIGPLAGAALLAGATGTLLFGALGFLLTIPMLRRLHRRSGSWAVPGGLLALMAVMFTLSTLVIGPALTGRSGESSAPSKSVPTAPPGANPSGHETHHR